MCHTEAYDVRDHRIDEWRTILSQRPVDDEEVENLFSEFRLTPTFVEGSIASQIRRQSINVKSIIPDDVRYYDRLVGEPEPNMTLREFVDATAAPKIRWQLERDPAKGLKAALLLSSHAWLPKAISLEGLPREKVVEVYQWLEGQGDLVSQIGAIECGLAHLEHYPELEVIIGRIVQQLIADSPDSEDGRLKMLCSMVVLVDGELARTGICRGRPPFWRRLASIAHASVLQRAILEAGMIPSDFNDWAMQNRGQSYYLQSFIDMRKEPRWNPDFILPDQLKAEFAGRIADAGVQNHTKMRSAEVKQLFEKEDPKSVHSHVEFPWAFLPGPLEGAVGTTLEMPSDIESDLRKALVDSELTPRSFTRLVNSALIFRIDEPLAKMAAEGLRRVKYQLRQIKSLSEAFSLLSGLATVAAVTRSADLAEEVRILLRVVRRKAGTELSQVNAMRIALIAAAAYADLSKWSKFVGECLTEFSFEDMTTEQAGVLRAHILMLRQLEPRLWETTARADAATSAFIQSSAA